VKSQKFKSQILYIIIFWRQIAKVSTRRKKTSYTVFIVMFIFGEEIVCFDFNGVCLENNYV
jgi:hypothetical protein